MITNATQFKNHLGEYMQKIYQEPVIIEKSGKPSAVLISYDMYEKLVDLEDFYWGLKAEEAAKEGFLSPKESEKRLRNYAKKAGIKIHDNINKAKTD